MKTDIRSVQQMANVLHQWKQTDDVGRAEMRLRDPLLCADYLRQLESLLHAHNDMMRGSHATSERQ